MPTLKAKLLSFAKDFKSSSFFLFQHRNVVLKKYYFILSYLKKYLHRKKAAHMCCQIMPFVGLTPFLLHLIRKERENNPCVSMPFIGLTPFLRYPLGTRIKQGHNSDIIAGNCLTIYFFHFFRHFFLLLLFKVLFLKKNIKIVYYYKTLQASIFHLFLLPCIPNSSYVPLTSRLPFPPKFFPYIAYPLIPRSLPSSFRLQAALTAFQPLAASKDTSFLHFHSD